MKIFVESPTGKFALDVDPTTKIEDIKNMVGDKVGIHPDNQQVKFDGKQLKDPSTVADCGMNYKDTLNVKQKPRISSPKPKKASLSAPSTPTADVPVFKVKMDSWQNSFDYNPKPKVKKDGVRERKHYNRLSDFYATAVNTDIELNRWDIHVEDKV
jgi:hypothetical protein